jgi:hypothetical protein
MTVFNLFLAAKGGVQHRKLMTDDEAEISVNGNRGHRNATFGCSLPSPRYRRASGECAFVIS